MTLLLFAHHAEAIPFLDQLQLKRAPERFPLFANNSILLAESGQGKTSACVVTAYLAGRYPLAEAYNIGTAAAANLDTPIGSCHLIHQIIDEASGREFFPDMLLTHPFSESSLTCFDTPISRDDPQYDPDSFVLGDMESAGFIEAASRFIPPHAAQVIKIVSDHGCTKIPERSTIVHLIEPHVEMILRWMEQRKTKLVEQMILTSQEQQELDAFFENSPLTIAQQNRVLEICHYAKLNQNNLRGIAPFPALKDKPSTKQWMQHLETEFLS